MPRPPTQIGDIRFDDKRTEDTGEVSNLSGPIQPAKLKRRELADASPVRTLPVNTSHSLSVSRVFEHIPKKIKKGLDDKPQETYHEFMSLDQAGPATIAHDKNYNLYTIKRDQASEDSAPFIYLFRDVTSVVSLRDVFVKGNEVLMVYETMDATLENVLATPRGYLTAREIGTVCKEVGKLLLPGFVKAEMGQIVHGLSFIHERLDLHHGDLNCGQILLDRAGHIKIGSRMLQGRSSTQEEKNSDIRSVGAIMMEMMEPATFLETPNSVALRHPERWGENTGIQDFLVATATASMIELKGVSSSPPNKSPINDHSQHHFLLEGEGRACLKPHVLMAQIAVRTDWKILTHITP
ncbi:hypothetical protein ACLMJK_009514 [Lecanora helva]